MCYYRRGLHTCHHTTLGTLISRCSNYCPSSTTPCPHQWSRAIFTVRISTACAHCKRVTGIRTRISSLTSSLSEKLSRPLAVRTHRIEARKDGLLPEQRGFEYYDTVEIRRPEMSKKVDDDCVSDAGSETSVSSCASFGDTASTSSTLSAISEEEELEELEFIPLRDMGILCF